MRLIVRSVLKSSIDENVHEKKYLKKVEMSRQRNFQKNNEVESFRVLSGHETSSNFVGRHDWTLQQAGRREIIMNEPESVCLSHFRMLYHFVWWLEITKIEIAQRKSSEIRQEMTRRAKIANNRLCLNLSIPRALSLTLTGQRTGEIERSLIARRHVRNE